jgi:hypothetical protein
MNKIIPSIIQDDGEYYIHMEEYKKAKELGEHYKHLYSIVKKQKDDVVEYIKENKNKAIAPYGDDEDTDYEVCLFEEDINEILRMLGEIDVED